MYKFRVKSSLGEVAHVPLATESSRPGIPGGVTEGNAYFLFLESLILLIDFLSSFNLAGECTGEFHFRVVKR